MGQFKATVLSATILTSILCAAGCGGCDREVYVRQSGAMITVNPSLLDFGQVPKGLVVTKTIEVLNPGQKALMISATELNDTNNVYMVTVPDDQVPQSNTMTITVTFSPTEIKTYDATFTLSTDAENNKLSLVALTGQGIPDSLCGDCSTPPENRCLSEYDLLIYDNWGVCVDEQCQYQASQIYCEHGCDEANAVCLDASGDVPVSPEPDAGVGVDEPETEDAGVDSIPIPTANDAGPTPVSDAGALPIYEGPVVEEIRVGEDGWTCARLSNGEVKCWGKNKWGQLGQGFWDDPGETTVNPIPSPVVLPESTYVTHLVTGNDSTSVVTDHGSVFCWGSCPHRRPTNQNGQFIHTPETVDFVVAGVDFDVGWGHACIVSATGTLSCWGSNWFGGLSTGDDTYPEDQPVNIASLNNITQVALGRYHTCALQGDDRLYCWGLNRYHQVGTPASEDEICPDTANDTTPSYCVLSPRFIDGLGDGSIIDVDTGGNHTCVIVETGKVFCWGNNQGGAIGNGIAQGFVWYGEPTATIELGQPAVQLALGSSHTMVILEDGSLMGWGSNNHGQLGDGTNERQPGPVPVIGLPLAVLQLSVGSSHTCAVLSDHSAWCWGKNEYGQLGNGTVEDSLVPIPVVFPGE